MNGFIGYFDILGFSELLRTLEEAAFEKKFEKYCTILNEATSREKRGLEYTFFSDSVIINSTQGELNDLLNISKAISEINYNLTMKLSVAICGCISYGNFTKRTDNGNTMITGTPILDAIRYEKNQNWVGTILSPIVFANFKQLKALIEMEPLGPKVVEQICTNISWLSTIQQYDEIPFPDGDFWGYVVLPRNSESKTIQPVIEDYEKYKVKLQELLLYAPNVHAQKKYEKTCTFLDTIIGRWINKTKRDSYKKLLTREID
ncbi:MAG: hypothetical protein ACTSQY_07515 [Candidatus Odinarchaeia archaeon]